ncbi:hypothetical protein BGX31_001926, partial [Mortierella sp. GBA43]
PFVHAQTFQPTPVFEPCSTFVEGQGLYVLGGFAKQTQSASQAFMLDLSVSWNTSRPVFKKLPDNNGSPSTCAMTSNGEILWTFGGFQLCNVTSNSKSWTTVPKAPTGQLDPATDPETGLIYALEPPGTIGNSSGRLIVADLKMMTFKESTLPAVTKTMYSSVAVAWSRPLRSMLVLSSVPNKLHMFTPGNVNDSSQGWKELSTAGAVSFGGDNPCLMSAYDGSKIVLYTYSGQGSVYILDAATLTWTTGPPIPPLIAPACGISGDQVVIWGGRDDKFNVSNTTYIYNMRTETWSSRFFSPSDTPLTTSTSPTHSHPTATSSPVDAASDNKKRIINIAIATGVMIVFLLTAISVYIGYRMRQKHDTTIPGTNGSVQSPPEVGEELLEEESHRPWDRVYPGPAPAASSLPAARLHQGYVGARGYTEHPHAIVSGSATGYNG